jgi:hypothetical protein
MISRKVLQSPQPSLLPVLRWWWVVIAAGIGAAATVFFMWWLLSNVVAQPNPRVASARLDAIRTALSLAVGTGGGLALWLAVRRQRSTELQLLETSRIATDNKTHQERVALFTELDLLERRITDLYTKAVEQLGNDKAPVRLGGLYALERLAQENPSHRQTVTNVICAYLKMPFIEPEGVHQRSGPVLTATASQEELANLSELQTRLVAQDILIRNLRIVDGSDSTNPNGRPPWKGIDLDLSGAVLVDFRLTDCLVRRATFKQARFVDVARFDNTRFEEDVWFFYSKFDRAYAVFSETKFDGRAIFTGSNFDLHAEFFNAQFAKNASFTFSTFRSLVAFKGANFKAGFSFERCHMEEITAPGYDKTSFGPAHFDFSDTIVDDVEENVSYDLPTGWMLSEPDVDAKRRIVPYERPPLSAPFANDHYCPNADSCTMI